ncbi:efflux RND transporter periplasmic adaptor subunit [Enterovirga rhinocerotis]|uniref:Membrane fusion protein (Multidrug efflux system) n=1 Tax=Enterovirga rhinocerotis TaxID=1339210 RepID=A0A4R7C5M0_9HYPH|nr:efflux RND transporter periplasmic adaptor subunit [Enterovirga rhinocerotis]TDR93192.1 membrane fusion protein (multidrug efflux system) [Enterovirga rhinocerotis]
MPVARAVAPAFLACLLAFGLAACNETQSSVPAPPALPPEVGFITAAEKPVAVVRELPGRVAPTRLAEVRARVTGLVTKRYFEQGSHVNQGDKLYQIDPAPFRAELASQDAEVARAEATLMLARQQAERFHTLLDRQAASKAQYENAYASMKQAEAALAGAKAAQSRARLNLDYATVRAPISGRIGRALLTEGALVDANSAQNLATIQQLDPIYVDITQSVGELRRLRRDLASGELSQIAPDVATVRLIHDDGTLYEHSGRLLFSEVTADPSTGQVTLRVEIPNPSGELFPGMYARARIEQAIDQDAIAVPQQAVQHDLDGQPQLYVVQDDDTVAARPVSLGDVVDGQWIVRDGVKSGDRVVVDGFQRISMGIKVKAVKLEGGRLTLNAPAPASSSDRLAQSETASAPRQEPQTTGSIR